MEFQNCRAIIIKDDKIVVMERELDGNHFYTFPGGKIEENETCEECAERETFEEFGITVKVKRLLYGYRYFGRMQGFYLADWVDGEIHKTDAEEYDANQKWGTYNPTTLPVAEIGTSNILPEEVARQLVIDLKNLGQNLEREYIFLGECNE